MSVSQILFIYHIDISNFILRFISFFHMQGFSLKMLSISDSSLPAAQEMVLTHCPQDNPEWDRKRNI